MKLKTFQKRYLIISNFIQQQKTKKVDIYAEVHSFETENKCLCYIEEDISVNNDTHPKKKGKRSFT